MKRFVYRNYDMIIKVLGIIFIAIGAIAFIYSLRPRFFLLVIGLLQIAFGIILLKLK